jgi:hypothetical protein
MVGEAGLVERHRLTEEQGAVALSAFGPGAEALPRNPVDRVAGGTDDVERFRHVG